VVVIAELVIQTKNEPVVARIMTRGYDPVKELS